MDYLILFGAWLFGVAVRFLFALAYDGNFSISHSKWQILLSGLLGFVVAYIALKMNLHTWIVYVVLFLLGFLSQYGLEWLNKRKG